VAALVAGGAEQVLIGASGDMATAGTTEAGEPWRIAIQDPRDADGSLGTLALRGECVATSGDYQQAFTQDRRFHHIVDPRTGRSPEHSSSVTVVAPRAMEADAFSTAAFVLGPVDGLAFLDGLEGVEGMIVAKDGRQARTRGLARYSA